MNKTKGYAHRLLPDKTVSEYRVWLKELRLLGYISDINRKRDFFIFLPGTSIYVDLMTHKVERITQRRGVVGPIYVRVLAGPEGLMDYVDDLLREYG